MDNEEELLDDKHFKDCTEFDELDADAENQLLGLSDEEESFEYEYVDENGTVVDINETNKSEYELVNNEETSQNENEQDAASDVLDLEIDHDLEFDDSTLANENAEQEESNYDQYNELPEEPEQEESANQEEYEEPRDEDNKLSDSSESDDENEGGRGRFLSERPNVVQLAPRAKRNNIPDSLDDVLKDDTRTGYSHQQKFRRGDSYGHRQNDRNRQHEFSAGGDRSSERHENKSQNYESPKSWNGEKNNVNNSTAENQAGPRKILINPHFKGAIPTPHTDVPIPNQQQVYWNANQNNANMDYMQQPPVSQFQQGNFGGHVNQSMDCGMGLLPAPSQMNMPPQMRPPPLLNHENANSNDFGWNRNPFPAPTPNMPPPNLMANNPNMPEPHPMMFPPQRERPQHVLPSNQYYNDNRPLQMRPPIDQHWNAAGPRQPFNQFNNFGGNQGNENMWKMPPNQNPPLINNNNCMMPKFPDIRQPPPNLQMQQNPRPLINFNAPPPNFSGMRPDNPPNNWTPQRPNAPINNFRQMPPQFMNNQPNNNNNKSPVPLRLPLPTPKVPPNSRFFPPRPSLLGSPVVMPKPPQFSGRPQLNAGNRQMTPRKPRPAFNPAMNNQPNAVPVFRKRPLENNPITQFKHQKTAAFANQQSGVVVRRKPNVNANIKEVKIVENLTPSENVAKVTEPAKVQVPEEDEETRQYREKIEMLNKKRAEILRIKEARREMMARQRRKLLLQKNISGNVELSDEPELLPQTNVNLKPIIPSPQIQSPTEASPAVKKRVVLRRVAVTPRPPRRNVIVNQPITANVSPVNKVLSGGPASAPVIRPNVVNNNRIVNLAGGPTKVPLIREGIKQPVRQLRAVVVTNKTDAPVSNPVPQKPNPDPANRIPRAPGMVNKTVVSGNVIPIRTNLGQQTKVLGANPNTGSNPNTVVIENLSLATTEAKLRQLCQAHGTVEKIEMMKEKRTATIMFSQSQHAKSFLQNGHRRMVDLSLITVSYLNP